MKLTTDGDIYTITLEPGDSLLVKFHPLGHSAPIGETPKRAATVSTMFLPNGGRMALRFEFPFGGTYQVRKGRKGYWENSLVALDDPNNPDELVLTPYEFKRFADMEWGEDENT